VDLPARFERKKEPSEFRLLYLGRLHPIKGIELLLEAGVMCDRLLRNWRLRVAGSGTPAYASSLKSKVQQLGLAARVEFLGEVSDQDKAALFADSDVTVVPSYSENFCIVVAESLAHGVPVIASRGTPWSGLEAHGCGLWVENEPPSLADAITRMQSMALTEMGLRGRAWMEKEFSWASVSSRMLHLYRNLCVPR